VRRTGAEDGGGRKPRINVTRSLRDAIQDLERAVEKAQRALDELYTVEWATRDTLAADARRASARKPAAPAGPAPAALNFQFDMLEKGRAAVSFAGGKRVTLPPALAALIAILASGQDESPDELVAWKSWDHIGLMLHTRFQRKFNHHAVSNLLTRLRGAFRAAGLDERLIESADPLGARLRLKRHAEALCAG